MKKHASITWWNLVSLTVAALGVPASVMAGDPPAPTPVAAVASAPAPTTTSSLPYGAQEVVKMYQGGISKEVITRYIEASVLPMHLTADGIIYLQHLGIPQEITAAMLSRDGELQKQAGLAYQQQMAANAAVAAANGQPAPAPGAPAPAPQVVMPSSPPPAVAPYPDVGPPAVAYPDYPAYVYPYYYGPDIIVGGWGWGHPWGWRGGWHGGGWHGGWHR